MAAKIRSLRDYTDCIRATKELGDIEQQLERFGEWYSQFYLAEADYENYIDEARKLITSFATRFEELAQEEIMKKEPEQ